LFFKPAFGGLPDGFGLGVQSAHFGGDSSLHSGGQLRLWNRGVAANIKVGGKDFQPDAWFGCRERNDDPVQPVTSAEFIDSFSEAFGLQRTNQTGLSVVVPSVDERVNTDDIRRGIVRSASRFDGGFVRFRTIARRDMCRTIWAVWGYSLTESW
jgi:hypothetical protein